MNFFTDYTHLALIALAIASGGLLAWPYISKSRQGISPQLATELINRQRAVIIDLRDAAEFRSGHLPEAKNIIFGDLEKKTAQLPKNKNNPLLLVCQTGQRARQAEKILNKLSYPQTYVLQGGLNAWQLAGMPISKENSKGKFNEK